MRFVRELTVASFLSAACLAAASFAGSPSTEEGLDEICVRCERELTCDVAPFWLKHSIDARYGGFITCLDRKGTPYDTFKHLCP